MSFKNKIAYPIEDNQQIMIREHSEVHFDIVRVDIASMTVLELYHGQLTQDESFNQLDELIKQYSIQ